MLYAILFASLIYVNIGQLPDFTLPSCPPESACTALNGNSDWTTGKGLLGVNAAETFVCSTNLKICTLTCSADSTTCDKINQNALVAISDSVCMDEGDGVMKCSVAEDRSCTTSSDCVNKALGALFPRCENNECVEQTPAPTPQPTPQPTRDPDADTPAPITSKPTTPPTTTAERIADCQAGCGTTDTVAYACEAIDSISLAPLASGTFELDVPCTDFDNKCQAECFVDGTVDYELKQYDQGIQDIARGFTADAFTDYCWAGSCSEGKPDPDTTTATDPDSDLTYEECMEKCELEDVNVMNCGGTVEIEYGTAVIPIEVECTDVRNECAAECFAAAETESIAETYSSLVTLDQVKAEIAKSYPNGLVADFCSVGTCDGDTNPDDDMSTTMDMATTGLDDDCYLDNGDECPDDDAVDGCNIQFNVTLDICILNRKFTKKLVRRITKLAEIYAASSVADFVCVEGDLSITRMKSGYSNTNALNRAKRKPKRKRTDDDDESTCGDDNDPDNLCCEDLDDICGADRKSKKYQLELDTQFKCGECEYMKKAVVTIQNLLTAFDAAFILQCLDLSIDGLLDVGLNGDDLCLTGFGQLALEVSDASLAYINDDGETEIELSSSNAYGIKYGLAVICAFIMAAIY